MHFNQAYFDVTLAIVSILLYLLLLVHIANSVHVQFMFVACCMLGPTKERDGTWRIKTDYQLNNLIRNKHISNYVKAQRLSWFGHVDRLTNDRKVEKLYYWKPMSRRLAGRPEIRLVNDIKGDLRIMGVNNSTKCTQDRIK